MKRVVSISLGSSRRDKKVIARFFGEEFSIERIGTDGDKQRFRRLVQELDGKVDAFGVGGCDIYLYAGDRRYVFREPLSLMAGAQKTPFVDGSGLKHTLERETIAWLDENKVVNFCESSVLLMSAVDRFGMAEALVQRARSIVFGDILFGLGLPIPIRSWTTLQRLARLILPIVVRCPFQWFYPTGEKQHQNVPKFPKFFQEADVIAGDYLYISKYMPQQLSGKTVITNTTTPADVEELKRRGVHRLITTTPVFDGRSFGTNVMEAVLVTLLQKRPEELTPQDYLQKLKELDWKPNVQVLNPQPAICAQTV
ncbi:hypothetical protein [Chthonomonas calidirosea]|uniref:Quinate 5-dehydrogenase n=1 Tax=Chthonomonas calidirosea (strain DSM 23976 / ICMP 18418 / T49) TaxID=1303518 RepID=S0EZB9_CHTCT|nr:hypothetical protein [Chthonomonas calidirosea]CCW36139.1 hypothetical protein CCALI_02335 [Chthonomonas calidirosea T49]CEK17175.1 hypothetical protein CP488_01761 [Chthonomonas calidirosea]CEK18222.1 hypothetical protein CTKA_01761 [Chthonomonas calidirosea]